jgi:hypothetical protein
MKLYKVEFKFTSGYSEPKSAGVSLLTVVVVSDGQFSALATAWDSIACLNLPEPKSFNAQELGKD